MRKKQKFCPLLLQLALNIQPKHKDFPVIPYDFHCPSVQSQLYDRTCLECGLYHASIKSLTKHCKIIHKCQPKQIEEKKKASRKLVQAKKIISKRESNNEEELLCIIKYKNAATEDIEWVDIEYVDTAHLEESMNEDDAAMPIIDSVSDWITTPWTEELY